MSPVTLSAPTPDGAELIGAEAVHQVLRRWLSEAAPAPVARPANAPVPEGTCLLEWSQEHTT